MATKKRSKKKVSKKTSTVKKSKGGVGSYCKKLIMSGKYSRDDIIEKCQKKYSDSAVNSKHISYYVWALKKDDQKVPAFKS